MDSVSLEEMLKGFSCPHEHLDDELFNQIVAEHAAATARVALERHSAALQQNGEGVAELLEQVVERGLDLPGAWETSWGDLFRTIHDQPTAAIADAAASLALWLGACGIPSDWSLRFTQPQRLRWDRILLPLATNIQVKSDGHLAQITLANREGGRDVITVRREGQHWQAYGRVRVLPAIETSDGKIILLTENAISEQTANYLELRNSNVSSELAEHTVSLFREGVAFLQLYAPRYIPWIFRVVRHIIPLKPEPRIFTSGSSAETPGMIHMSLTQDPRAIAEVLVHEATHQYIHVVRWLGPLDDGTDANLYYSPLKKLDRPLFLILVAFHAVVNISLYYRDCRENGAPDNGFFSRNEPIVLRQIDQLVMPLRGNAALTDLGRALCQPLLERL